MNIYEYIIIFVLGQEDWNVCRPRQVLPPDKSVKYTPLLLRRDRQTDRQTDKRHTDALHLLLWS